MSKLPYNLASSHYSGEDVYNLYLDGDRSYWASMSDKKRAKWDAMAAWINERTPHTIDVSAVVDEIMRRRRGDRIPFITPAPTKEELERFDGITSGVNIHDDDIAASAQRFLNEVDDETLIRLGLKKSPAQEAAEATNDDFVAQLKQSAPNHTAASFFGTPDGKMSKEQYDLLTKLKAEDMMPDAPAKPTAVEIIDALADAAKRLFG